jgi:hypothetical protein
MDVDESWLFMIMEFIEEIVCDWVEIYWIVIARINGCWWILVVYGYGILMKICIDDWVVKCWIKNYVEMIEINMRELLGTEWHDVEYIYIYIYIYIYCGCA